LWHGLEQISCRCRGRRPQVLRSGSGKERGFHELKGDLAGHFSVKVNGNWRITFRFEGEDAILVDYQDYHQEETMEMYNPAHPGAVLKDVLEGIPMTVGEFAAHIGVSRNTLSRILNERASVTPEMSIKIAEALGQEQTDIWFKIQNKHDFWHAKQAKRTKVRPIKIKQAA
jgi:antitoxin HigA-1